MFVKILIVVPKLNSEMRPQYNFSVGLASIKSVLRQRGYEIMALNLNHISQEREVLTSYILENKVDVVMTGGLTAHYNIIKDIFKVAKSVNKKIITIGGGGGFTSEPILFAEMAEVDYACLGEGEVTICELVDAIIHKKDISTIQGIVYKNEYGQYIQNQDRPVIEDINALPFPDYEGFDMDKYLEEQTPYDYYFTYIHDEPRMFPIFMGRSCPYQCNFCFHPLGNKYRQRSLENFFAELDSILAKYQVNSLAIFDELFSLEEKRIFEFCKRIKAYGLKWTVQMRVNIINKQLLEIMREAGCFNISYGLESINDKVLKNMKKKIKKEEIERALELTYQCGIGIQGNFIFGDEEEDMDTFSETLNWWKEHRKYQINLAFIETYPGTQLYKNAVKKGLIADRKKFIEKNCPVINLTKQPEFVFQKMQSIVALAEFHDYEAVGKVINIEQNSLNPDFVTAAFKCYHCNEISTIKRISAKRIYSNHFKICCRHCNQKSVYDTRAYFNIRDSDFKYKMYFTLLRQWMTSQKWNEGVFENYFKANDITTGAIFFEEEFGPIFYEEIEKMDIEILFIIDQEADNRYQPIVKNIPIIKLDGLEKREKVDVVIVTEIFDFKKKRQELISAGYKGRIVSLEDIIFGITMQ